MSTWHMTRLVATLVAGIIATNATAGAHDRAAGRVDDQRREPVAGATVTIVDPSRGRSTTVYTDRLGRFTLPELPAASYDLTVTHPDHRTLRIPKHHIGARTALALRVTLEPDPSVRARALAANRWLALVLERLPSDEQRQEILQQCTSCHQFGSPATRRRRSAAKWAKIVALMARMGGTLTRELRRELPLAAHAAQRTPDAARQVLGQGPTVSQTDPAAVVTTWALNTPGAILPAVTMGSDGHVYAVDVAHDALHRLDPEPGTYETFAIPHGGAPLGGRFAGPGLRLPANVTARTGPSSLDVAPDGTLWLTLALANALARFDPGARTWTIHGAPRQLGVPRPLGVQGELGPLGVSGDLAGLFPTNLRIDLHGRLWYALALSNRVGSFDPTRGTADTTRLPARNWLQAVAAGLAPAREHLFTHAALPAPSIGPAVDRPAPAGLDVAPDGGVWFTQVNAGRIGRIDPITRTTQIFDTPFPAPRHLRCDSNGRVWFSGAATGRLARFDPVTEQFATWVLPIEPAGTDTASALAVGPPFDTVWIGGANSDTLLRFDSRSETFTIYPLPRGTVVRALTVDPTGTVWGVTGSTPTWHGAGAAILRLQPGRLN